MRNFSEIVHTKNLHFSESVLRNIWYLNLKRMMMLMKRAIPLIMISLGNGNQVLLIKKLVGAGAD